MTSTKLFYLSIALLAAFVDAEEWPCTILPNGERIPHTFDCTLYFVCSNGDKVVQACPAGTYFDENTRVCDLTITSSGCVSGTTPTICHNVNYDFFPSPHDCEQYIECYNGAQYDLKCPSGLWFDSVTKVCQSPALAHCSSAPITPPATTDVCYGVSANQVAVRPIPNYCEYYYRCLGLVHTVEHCPSGQYFNSARDMCDFIQFVTCNVNYPGPPVNGTITGPTLVPTTDPRCAGVVNQVLYHPADCAKYIQCVSGAAYEATCTYGMYFEPSYGQCVSPQYASCIPVTQPPVNPPSGPISSDCPYPISEGKLLPFPGDCTKYFECAEGIKVEMDCPAGLWWHQLIGECDYPYLSNCVG